MRLVLPQPGSEHTDPQTMALQFRRRRPISIRCGVRRCLRSARGWPGGAPRSAPAPGARIGRFAPELLEVAAWPYFRLGCDAFAVALWIVGAQRRELESCARTGSDIPLRFRTVGLFTVGGVALAVMTVVSRDRADLRPARAVAGGRSTFRHGAKGIAQRRRASAAAFHLPFHSHPRTCATRSETTRIAGSLSSGSADAQYSR